VHVTGLLTDRYELFGDLRLSVGGPVEPKAHDAVREAARAISRELGASTWPAGGR